MLVINSLLGCMLYCGICQISVMLKLFITYLTYYDKRVQIYYLTIKRTNKQISKLT